MRCTSAPVCRLMICSPCSRQPDRLTTTLCPSGERIAERGMLPSGEERPAGSRRTPVGSRALELSDAGMSDGGALAEREGLEQLASVKAASRAMAGRVARSEMVTKIRFLDDRHTL